jgi:hypothetical protein
VASCDADHSRLQGTGPLTDDRRAPHDCGPAIITGRSPRDHLVLMEVPMAQNNQWFVTNLTLSGGSVVSGIGVAAFLGQITLQHVLNGVPTYFTKSIAVSGMAAGLSEGIPNQQNPGIAQKIVTFIVNNGGLSFANAWSVPPLGICFPNTSKVSSLQSSYFLGDCALIFYSANAGPLGTATYILVFGLPIGFWSWQSTFLQQISGLIAWHLRSHCKGAALITCPLGASLSGSLGAAVYAMYGRII